MYLSPNFQCVFSCNIDILVEFCDSKMWQTKKTLKLSFWKGIGDISFYFPCNNLNFASTSSEGFTVLGVSFDWCAFSSILNVSKLASREKFKIEPNAHQSKFTP